VVGLVDVVGDNEHGWQRLAELEAGGVGCQFVGRTDAAPTGATAVTTVGDRPVL
jgi:sugar/nucleoside kinase (ribokinase family)